MKHNDVTNDYVNVLIEMDDRGRITILGIYKDFNDVVDAYNHAYARLMDEQGLGLMPYDENLCPYLLVYVYDITEGEGHDHKNPVQIYHVDDMRKVTQDTNNLIKEVFRSSYSESDLIYDPYDYANKLKHAYDRMFED